MQAPPAGNVATPESPPPVAAAVPGRSRAPARPGGWRSALADGVPAIALAFAFGFLLAALATALAGFPLPRVHDEFSYLLGADTFAHGRLTNPPHPMWRFFETFQVLQQPTYASKYPPAQSLFLALGQVLTGNARVGVWLSFGLMCAALLWMLRAWVGERWALAVTAAFTIVLAPTYWATSYWGGAVAATGGALLYGGLRRALVPGRPAPVVALLLGCGVLLLANSRPVEGAVLSLPAALVLAGWLASAPAAARRDRTLRFALPLTVVLAVGGAWLLAYNHAVTGQWLQLPHELYQRQYDGVPVFRFQAFRGHPWSPHEVIRRFQLALVPMDLFHYRPKGVYGPPTWGVPFHVAVHVRSLAELRFAFPQPWLWLALLFVLAALDRWTLLAAGTLALMAVGAGSTTFFMPHYAAPAVPLLVALWAIGIRRTALVRARKLPVGLAVAFLAVGAWAVGGAGQLVKLAGPHEPPPGPPGVDWLAYRQRLADSLTHSGGKHLVLVAYGPSHSPNNEWVYNAADIDGAPVVFARDMGLAADVPLFRYFRERSVWRVSIDRDVGPFVLDRIAAPRARPQALEEP